MELNWTAVLTGFVVTIVLGVLSGYVFEGTSTSLALVYWAVIGIVGGLSAGYVAGGSMGHGAYNGGVATVIGSVVILAIATLSTLLFAGLIASLGVLVFGVSLLVFYAIPGAIGGAVGSWARGRSSAPEPAGVRD